MYKNIRQLTRIYAFHNELSRMTKRYAGHSKWANIRHIKGLKDAERANYFLKLSRQMKVAIQEGGSVDPAANSKLSNLIDQARRASMPAATIQSILKGSQTDKKPYKRLLLEIKGPGSCLMLCEIFSDNPHLTKQGIATILRKNGGKYIENITSLFTEKGIIEAEVKSSEEMSKVLEKATDDAIEAGAEDVTDVDNNILQFLCGSSNLKAVTTELEAKGYNILSSSIEYLPLKYQTLNEKDMETYLKLHEKLESVPEVVRIINNIEVE
ncbi:translational activator of cytochrome c oxidase 1 [Coccinella septempunctata]|uniref:translational activator of cytochrome c oxidase 1 n=1 Tax=Coccinella septempunctata TaxID=41139 RepID=UPI001D06BDC4|nr:translational activator of cytochrome c oxidase 1 [Coccinella septempunctata]